MTPRPGLIGRTRAWLYLVGAPLALVYFLTLGGTPIGEQLGSLRVVNSALGAGFILLYVIRAPRRADRIDVLVLGALLLFAAASVTSALPRQSLDALLAAMAYAAVFFVARDFVRLQSAARLLVWTMRGICAAVALVAASRYIPSFVEWWSLMDGAVLPPLGLPLSARPWGHAYDLVTLGLMLYPSWLVAPGGRVRLAGAIVVGVLLAAVVLLLGSRAHWVAIGLASAFLAIPHVVRRLRQGGRVAQAGAVVVVVAALGPIVLLGGPILERLFSVATLGQRVEMWGAASEAWLNRPITGYGPGTFPWALQTTDYFETHSLLPRHPDSAIFQLLPEVGLLGIGAAALVLAAVVWPLLRGRKHLLIWPIALFLFAGIGANPTDFSYLIVVAALWAAIGLPRPDPPPESVIPRRASLWPAHAVAMVLIAIPVGAMLLAGLRFDGAARAIHGGDIGRGRDELDAAVALDPGMALYLRQRGIANLLLDEAEGAVPDLRRAGHLNPHDDVTWRALSIALEEQGDQAGAATALDRAIQVQRSDPTNLILLAFRQAQAGDEVALREAVPEIALAWPNVLAAPGWADLIDGAVSMEEVVSQALDRWERGDPSLEPLRNQPLRLVLIGERQDLFESAAALTGEAQALADAASAVAWCDPSATEVLASVPLANHRSETYAALLIQHAAERGSTDAVALRLYELATFDALPATAMEETLNPLRDYNVRGSVDTWGYDRVTIGWPPSVIELPNPDAGAARWILDPAGARAALALTDGLGACPTGQDD